MEHVDSETGRIPPTAPLRVRVETILLFAGAAVYLFLLPHHLGGDGAARFAALDDLMRHRSLTSARYSILQPLLSIPLWLIGQSAGRPGAIVALFNTLVFFAGLLALWATLRRVVDAPVLRRFLLILTACSMFPCHVQTYSAETLSAVLFALGLALLWTSRARLGAASLAAGALNAPAALGGLLLSLIPPARRLARWTAALATLAAAAALVCLESWIRRGSPLVSGYENDRGFATVMPYSTSTGFTYPFFLGLLSILFSFGKGLVFFAPGLWLLFAQPRNPLSSQCRGYLVSCALFVAGLVLVYSKWWAWYGGWFWGPRFFLFASVPAGLALAVHLSDEAASLRMRLLTLAALLLSSWVGICAAVFGQYGLDICRENKFALEHLCWYAPEFSVLWRPFITPKPLDTAGAAALSYFAFVGAWLAGPLIVEVVRKASARLPLR